MEVRRLTARREHLYLQLLGDRKPVMMPGISKLLDVLQKHNVRPEA